MIQFTYGQCKMEWYLTRQDPTSQQPSTRSVPSFLPKNETHAILYGGYLEHIVINRPDSNNTFYNDIFIMNAENPDLIKWTQIQKADSSPEPIPRAYSCVVYSKSLDALYVYGGFTYNPQFTQINFFSDIWKFEFANLTWTLIQENGPAGNRAGMGCDILADENVVYLTYGTVNTLSNALNDTWMWELETNTWTLLTNISEVNRPTSRSLHVFRVIGSTHDFLFFDGLSLRSINNTNRFSEVWIFHSDTATWQQNVVNNPPAPRGTFAYTLTSEKWFFMHSGDFEETNITENCLPPLECIDPADPTDESFFMKFKDGSSKWTDELELAHSTPPLRHASIVNLEPNLYLVGGMDWSGKNGVGEEYNYFTYSIILTAKYFN